ncbi:MAG TPA: CoA pyrophosphatase [Longimicrobiales bacterium]|nr:CoA pyrophosphatase [Longimicrobiales bacterium]
MRDELNADPRLNMLRRSFEGRPASGLPRTAGLREAAVALLVRPRSSLELLLIRRADLPGDPWSGHVALPGGRRERHDADLLGTARRETEEEVGVPLARVGSFVGALDELSPGSVLLPPIVVAPFVLAVPPDTTAVPAPGEVQAAIWVPLDALASSTALSEVPVELPWGKRNFPCLVYEDYIIWGLTYRILQQFLSVAGMDGLA